MTFDPNTIAPEAKAEAITLGRRYNSQDTYNQAELTLKALGQYGAVLSDHGYGADDAAELLALKDALYASGVTRQEARYGKKVGDAGYLSALVEARAVRLRSRTVLLGTRKALLKEGTGEGKEKAQWIEAVLKQTSPAAEEGAGLSEQLKVMVPLFQDTVIGDAAKGRGGVKALVDAEAVMGKLLSASQAEAAPRGTPVQTEALDMLDGLIVWNVRLARDAAKSASRELGEEAIQKSFELTALPSRSGGKGVEGSGGEAGGGGAGGGAVPGGGPAVGG